jgi:hypothetical protein
MKLAYALLAAGFVTWVLWSQYGMGAALLALALAGIVFVTTAIGVITEVAMAPTDPAPGRYDS